MLIYLKKALKILWCCQNTITKVKKSIELAGSIPDQLSPGRTSKITTAVTSFVTQQTFSNLLISGKDLSFGIKSLTIRYFKFGYKSFTWTNWFPHSTSDIWTKFIRNSKTQKNELLLYNTETSWRITQYWIFWRVQILFNER